MTASISNDCFCCSYKSVAKTNARLPAVLKSDIVLTHGDIWQCANSFAVRMRELGVGSGSVVALNTGVVEVVLSSLLATSIIGAGFVIASKTVAKRKLVRPTHFFRTSDALGAKNVEFKLIDETWFPRNAEQINAVHEGCGNLDREWIYLPTSGTTGRPKYVALSERMIIERCAAVSHDFPFRETTLATTFNVASRPFIVRSLAALLNACAICDGQDTSFWKQNGVNLVCGAPGQLETLFRDKGGKLKFEKVESSGALLSTHSVSELLNHFDTVVDVYGATETNKSYETIFCRRADGTVAKRAAPRDSAIEILSPEGEVLPTGKIGALRVRNSYMVNGYLNDPAATEASFRDGWFHPGDLAAWGETGELVIVGREDDVINFGGYKMNAGMLDMFFKRIPGIRDAIAFNNPKIDSVNKVLVFAVFEDDQRQHEAIAAACDLAVKQMGFLMIPSCIRPVKAIPRTEAGDPDRLACRKMVARRAEIDIDDAG